MQITGSKLAKRKNIFPLEVAVNHLRMFTKCPDFLLLIRRIRCRLVHATSNECYIHQVDRSSIASGLAQQVFSPIELLESAARILSPGTYMRNQTDQKKTSSPNQRDEEESLSGITTPGPSTG